MSSDSLDSSMRRGRFLPERALEPRRQMNLPWLHAGKGREASETPTVVNKSGSEPQKLER